MKISKLYSNNDNFKTIEFDKGIQTIITSNESAIHNPENLLEIKNEYMTGYLSNGDKLMGDF